MNAVHHNYQAQAEALAQHAQAETSARVRAWEREKTLREKLGRGKR